MCIQIIYSDVCSCLHNWVSKKGLPHAHIIIWLAESDKCHTTDEIDDLICAEIPDKETDLVGYEAILKYMIHGPCGLYNPNCTCMLDGKCTKYFAKEFTNETTIGSNGYPVYRRRDDLLTIQIKDISIDNRYQIVNKIILVYSPIPHFILKF